MSVPKVFRAWEKANQHSRDHTNSAVSTSSDCMYQSPEDDEHGPKHDSSHWGLTTTDAVKCLSAR
jgi:hypothetical protein